MSRLVHRASAVYRLRWMIPLTDRLSKNKEFRINFGPIGPNTRHSMSEAALHLGKPLRKTDRGVLAAC